MSDRDVIYVTRAVIPLLAQHNITGLTIGSNGADYPPQARMHARMLLAHTGAHTMERRVGDDIYPRELQNRDNSDMLFRTHKTNA